MMSFRTKGSPPVTLILSTPEAMKHRATRSSSSNESSCLLGRNVIASDMQYRHLRSQRSVTDSRRYFTRPCQRHQQTEPTSLASSPLQDRYRVAKRPAQSRICRRQHVGDRHEFFPRLAERSTPALLGRVDGNPIAVAHDARDAMAQPCQQRIGIAGTPPRKRGQIRKNGLRRGHAAAAVGADGAARTALAPTTDVETGND